MTFGFIGSVPGIVFKVAAQNKSAVSSRAAAQCSLEPMAGSLRDDKRQIAPSAFGFKVVDSSFNIDISGFTADSLPRTRTRKTDIGVGNGKVIDFDRQRCFFFGVCPRNLSG